MTCLMHSSADAWVVLLQVRESELQSCTSQPAELQSVVEGEHAVTSDLGGSLTASQQELAAAQQVKSSAAEAHSAASQVGNILASCPVVVMQLQRPLCQLTSRLICLMVPSHHAITVPNMQQAACL